MVPFDSWDVDIFYYLYATDKPSNMDNMSLPVEKLSFTIDSTIFNNIVKGKQKAFVASIKPSEIQNYFYYTLDKKIDVKYFNRIEFKTTTAEGTEESALFKIGFAEMNFLIPNELLDKAVGDLTVFYDSDHMPPAEIVFEIKEKIESAQ